MKRYQSLFLVIIAVLTGGMIYLSSALSASETCVYHEEAYQGMNLSSLSVELEKTGLLGEIHGAVEQGQLYVLTVRHPDNFFQFRHFSLIPANRKTKATLGKLHRHDKICLKGKLIDNPSPQPHILVSSAKIRESWTGLEGYEEYKYQAKIPEDLKNKSHLIVKVHAINEEGKILVVEYKDKVLPIFVKKPKLTKDLYRGDLIEISFKIQSFPENPTHLEIDLEAEKSLKIIDKLVNQHEKKETLRGKLVKFPQSPQLKFDVYAIEVITQDIPRYFTLVNFEDEQEFEKIRLKLEKLWNENSKTIEAARNFLINPNVIIEAQGTINLISPQQANPQILLEDETKIRQLNQDKP